MPLYEYRCKNCGHQFEIQQALSEDNLTVCPNCQGELRKVFSPVGITFKGSGFYKNDSRGASSSTTPAGDSSSGSESKSGGSNDGASKDSGSQSNGSQDGGSKSSDSSTSSGSGSSSSSGSASKD